MDKYAEMVRQIISQKNYGPDVKIVEVGSGGSVFARALAERLGVKVMSTDKDPKCHPDMVIDGADAARDADIICAVWLSPGRDDGNNFDTKIAKLILDDPLRERVFIFTGEDGGSCGSQAFWELVESQGVLIRDPIEKRLHTSHIGLRGKETTRTYVFARSPMAGF